MRFLFYNPVHSHSYEQQPSPSLQIYFPEMNVYRRNEPIATDIVYLISHI